MPRRPLFAHLHCLLGRDVRHRGLRGAKRCGGPAALRIGGWLGVAPLNSPRPRHPAAPCLQPKSTGSTTGSTRPDSCAGPTTPPVSGAEAPAPARATPSPLRRKPGCFGHPLLCVRQRTLRSLFLFAPPSVRQPDRRAQQRGVFGARLPVQALPHVRGPLQPGDQPDRVRRRLPERGQQPGVLVKDLASRLQREWQPDGGLPLLPVPQQQRGPTERRLGPLVDVLLRLSDGRPAGPALSASFRLALSPVRLLKSDRPSLFFCPCPAVPPPPRPLSS